MGVRIKVAAEAVRRQEERMRGRVNHTLFHAALRGRPAAFNRICSSMDAIGDTTLALASLELGGSTPDGEAYLLAHGLYQSVAIMLDSCKLIADQVGAELDDRLILEIRALKDLRVRISGHPQSSRGDKRVGRPSGAHGIGRYSLSREGFMLHGWYDDGTSDILAVSNFGIARRALSVARRILKAITRQLDTEIVGLETEWGALPAARHFVGLAYACEKLLLDVPKLGDALGAWAIGQIAATVRAVRDDSRLMSIWGSEIECELSSVGYGLQRLRDHYPDTCRLDDAEERLYAKFVCDRLTSLWGLCTEIDKSFSRNEQGAT